MTQFPPLSEQGGHPSRGLETHSALGLHPRIAVHPARAGAHLWGRPQPLLGELAPGLGSLQVWSHFSCSVAQSCPALCDPKDCSTPGSSVLHHLLEFAQTHILQFTHSLQLRPPQRMGVCLGRGRPGEQGLNSDLIQRSPLELLEETSPRVLDAQSSPPPGTCFQQPRGHPNRGPEVRAFPSLPWPHPDRI